MTLELFPDQLETDLHFEQQAARRGFTRVAGVDEAGRGPLAGPVVAAAALLPENFELPGLTDSKKLSAARREKFFPLIRQQAVVGVGIGTVEEIEERNILQATLLAMQRAVQRISGGTDFLLVDGITPIPGAADQLTLKKGDSRSLSIAAASVIAKVVRDRLMAKLDRLYPGYGLAGHKGYGSAAHREAIARLGPSPIHRRTFAGVREHLPNR